MDSAVTQNTAVEIMVTVFNDEMAAGLSACMDGSGVGAKDCSPPARRQSSVEVDIFHPCGSVTLVVSADLDKRISPRQDKGPTGVFHHAIPVMGKIHHPIMRCRRVVWQKLVKKKKFCTQRPVGRKPSDVVADLKRSIFVLKPRNGHCEPVAGQELILQFADTVRAGDPVSVDK